MASVFLPRRGLAKVLGLSATPCVTTPFCSSLPAFLRNLSLPAWHITGPFAQRHSLVHCETDAAEGKGQMRGRDRVEEAGRGEEGIRSSLFTFGQSSRLYAVGLSSTE